MTHSLGDKTEGKGHHQQCVLPGCAPTLLCWECPACGLGVVVAAVVGSPGHAGTGPAQTNPENTAEIRSLCFGAMSTWVPSPILTLQLQEAA